MVHNKELDTIKKFMSNPSVNNFIIKNLRKSMKILGHSEEFLLDLENFFTTMNLEKFHKENRKILHEKNTIGYIQIMQSKYFDKHIIPNIPKTKELLDLGCGTGILLHILKDSEKFEKIIGIDIDSYPEWKQYRNENLSLEVVKPRHFKEYLERSNATGIIITCVLHHMSFELQEQYLKEIYNSFENITITILEDTYSKSKTLVENIGPNREFEKLNHKEKIMVISTNDWIANRLLLERKAEPIPFTYRSMEEWENLFTEIGFKIKKSTYLGFPKNRDVYTPQGLFVIEK